MSALKSGLLRAGKCGKKYELLHFSNQPMYLQLQLVTEHRGGGGKEATHYRFAKSALLTAVVTTVWQGVTSLFELREAAALRIQT